LLICLALVGRVSAQPQGEVIATTEQPGAARPPASIPPLPVQSPRPLAEVTNVFGKLSSNDAFFEVTLGQARILPIQGELKVGSTVAIGDPSVIDYNILNPRQLRILGQRLGVTDLSIVSGDQVYSFEVRVIADLDPLRLQLRAGYPDAQIKLTPHRDHILVEGQARDTPQVARIIETIRMYIDSIYATELRRIRQTQAPAGGFRPGTASPPQPIGGPPMPMPGMPMPMTGADPAQQQQPQPVAYVSPEQSVPATVEATVLRPQIVNLIKVPGPQQVLLKVRIAELNRTALRQIGADFLAGDARNGVIIGSQIGGATVTATGAMGGGFFAGAATNSASARTTLFGIFERANLDLMISALRRNNILKILAEPNLMAMNGHQASFLAGGKFPVPIPQAVSGGVGATVTVQFEKFGVQLDFLPFILDDDRVRLSVHPQVSSIDFAIGTVLVPGGTPVPGLNSREARTTVELRQGQTLAIAGLLQLTLDGQTGRIPGLGDLPILGPFFSNTTETRMEKELVVLVTPYLVDAMNPDQVPPTPGDEVKEPNDLEFFFLNRLEGRTGRDFRSTVQYDDATHLLRCLLRLEKNHVRGPHGFCDD
jgi:pilus assembly protein CpaC